MPLRRFWVHVLFVSMLAGWASPAHARVQITLDRPGDREFVRDLADLVSESDEQAIREQCDKLLTERAIPLLVVTIPSMAAHGGEGLRIETFATLLFDQWGIGMPELNDQPWNRGILLLVSVNDRKARIELGAGWGREKDAVSQRIMDEQIISRFKQGDFAAGIQAGVTALIAMARDEALPSAPKPRWFWPAVIGLVVIAGVTAFSLARSGASGWAWLIWGAIFAGLGVLLYHLATSRSSSGGGGGFSGGGGATGSW